MSNVDEELSQRLRKDFNLHENDISRDNDLENIDLESIENIVHPQWEIRDPNPDIYMLFIKFNQLFFENKLNDVLINWNKRMTALGGAFYEADGGLEICLSEPILKYRSRKAIIETLLHEMIHAYCYKKYKNSTHGTEFKRMMRLINERAKTNITITHTFLAPDEIFAWRCDGICRQKPPMFGWFRRLFKRAPNPCDKFWHQHKKECSGKFHQVKEKDDKLTEWDYILNVNRCVENHTNVQDVTNANTNNESSSNSNHSAHNSADTVVASSSNHSAHNSVDTVGSFHVFETPVATSSSRRRNLFRSAKQQSEEYASLVRHQISEETGADADNILIIDAEFNSYPISNEMFINYDKETEQFVNVERLLGYDQTIVLGIEPSQIDDQNICIICKSNVEEGKIIEHLEDCTKISFMDTGDPSKNIIPLPVYKIKASSH